MKAPAVIDILIHSIVFNRRTILFSIPGSGKSDLEKTAVKMIIDIANGKLQYNKPAGVEILKNANYWKLLENEILHPVVSDPTDWKGFPFVNKDGQADFVPFAILKRMLETKVPLVIFLDDCGQAPAQIQSCLMQLLLERSINGKRISDNVRFIAATNSRKDNAGVGNLITPFLNRFDTILQLDVDSDSWCRWALNQNVPIELVQFLRFRPNLISTFKAEKDIKNFASPRSIFSLSKWLVEGIIDIEVWTGCVGEEFAIEFMSFYKTFQSLAELPDQVFNNPLSAKILDKPDQMFALLGVLSKRVNDVNINNLFKYLDRIPKEFQMVVVSNIISGKPELRNTKAYIDWQIKNKNMI